MRFCDSFDLVHLRTTFLCRYQISNIVDSMSEAYKSIAALQLTEQQLQKYGFPRRHRGGKTGMATIYVPELYPNTLKPNICRRCQKPFQPDHYDKLCVKECNYHPKGVGFRGGKNQLE